ncbi:MAG: hypothetical protein WBI25_03245, partial [Smithellaceae bacterium]
MKLLRSVMKNLVKGFFPVMFFKGIITVIRVPFLLLALILGILGAAVAWYEARLWGSPFHLGYALL